MTNLNGIEFLAIRLRRGLIEFFLTAICVLLNSAEPQNAKPYQIVSRESEWWNHTLHGNSMTGINKFRKSLLAPKQTFSSIPLNNYLDVPSNKFWILGASEQGLEYNLLGRGSREAFHYFTKKAKAGHTPSIDALFWHLYRYLWLGNTDSLIALTILRNIPDKNNLTLANYLQLLDEKKNFFRSYGNIRDKDTANFYGLNSTPIAKFRTGFTAYFSSSQKEFAKQYLEEAAHSGIPDAKYWLARIMMEEDPGNLEPEVALNFLYEAGKNGHFLAIRTLGDIFFIGDLTARNYALARHFYELGSNLGDTHCKNMLGHIFQFGLGDVEVNLSKAFEHFEFTAKSNNSIGNYRISKVIQDKTSSNNYLLKAIELGLEEAKEEYVTKIYKHGGSLDDYIKAYSFGKTLQLTEKTKKEWEGIAHKINASGIAKAKKMMFKNLSKNLDWELCGGIEIVAEIGDYSQPAILRIKVEDDGTVTGGYFYIKHKKILQLEGKTDGNFVYLNEFYRKQKTGMISLNLTDPYLSTWHGPNSDEQALFEVINIEYLDYDQFYQPAELMSFELSHTVYMYDGSDDWITTDEVDLYTIGTERSSDNAYLRMSVTRSNAHLGGFNGLLSGRNWYSYKYEFEIPECLVRIEVPPSKDYISVSEECRMCCGARAGLDGFYPKAKIYEFNLTDLPR